MSEQVQPYTIDVATGLMRGARQVPSPNCDDRPADADVSLVVLHGISLPPACFDGDCVADLFTNQLDWNSHPYFREIEGLKVSSHLYIRRTGEVVQFVPFTRRAWHAGASAYRGRSNCNDFSLGIELEGTDDVPYENIQYTVLATVLKAVFEAYPRLTARDLAGHCDIAPGRKTDPGPAFDWMRLYDSLLIPAAHP
jgi:AmpD protein